MKKDVKERIEVTAMKLFMERGIKAVTMDELASHMGISKRTIYELFSDKDQLLIETIEYHNEKNDRFLKAFTLRCKNVLEVFHCYMHQGVAATLATGVRLVEDIRKYHPKVYQQVIEKYEKERVQGMIKMLERGASEKLFRNDFNRPILVALLHQQMDSLFLPSNPLRAQFALEELYEVGLMTFIRGICTEAGLKEMARLGKEEEAKRNINRVRSSNPYSDTNV